MHRTIPSRRGEWRDRSKPSGTTRSQRSGPRALRHRQDRPQAVHRDRSRGFTAPHVGVHARQGPHRDPPPPPGPEGPHPRVPGLSLQVEGPRPAARQRPAGPRAPRQADGPGRVRLRRPVVHGVRQRGDPPHPAVRRRCHRRAGVQLPRADHAGPGGGARHPDLQLPPDHQGLPLGRWRLHRHQGQPRPPTRPGRRRGPAHRLHPHRVGVGVGRRRRPLQRLHARCTRTGCRSPSAFIAVICVGNLRGVKESGQDLRRPDVPVHRRHVPHDHHRPGYKAVLGGGIQLRRAGRTRPPSKPWEPPSIVLVPARLRLRRRRHDRRRGHLQRGARVQAASSGSTPARPSRVMGVLLGIDVHRHLVARRQDARRAPSESQTVISQIANAVYGSGADRARDLPASRRPPPC